MRQFFLFLFVSFLFISASSEAAEITITADTLIENPYRGGSEIAGEEIWKGQGSASIEVEWRSTSSNSGMIETSIRIYPNPVKSVLNIEGLEGGSLEIYSLTGSLLLKEKFRKQLDISHLGIGIYYLIARNQAGQVTVPQRIITH